MDHTDFDLSVCLNEKKKMNDHAMTIILRTKKLILVDKVDGDDDRH